MLALPAILFVSGGLHPLIYFFVFTCSLPYLFIFSAGVFVFTCSLPYLFIFSAGVWSNPRPWWWRCRRLSYSR